MRPVPNRRSRLAAVFAVLAAVLWTVPGGDAAETAGVSVGGGQKTGDAPGGLNKVLRGHGGPVKSIALSADGSEALTGSFDYSMIHWRTGSGTPSIIRRFDDHDAAVNAVRFVPGGERVLSAGDDGHVRLWNLTSGELIKRFEGHTFKVVSLGVSADGRYAISAAWDGTARVWDLKNLAAGAVLKGHVNSVNAAAVSMGGEEVFTADYNGVVRAFDISTGELKRQIYKHGWGINVLHALPGGRRLFFGGLDGAVGTLDLVSGKVGKLLSRHERPVLSGVVSAKHNLAATGGAGGVIQVWDITTWELKYRHTHPFGPVWSMALAGDGKGLYFGGLDDHVAYWQMDPDKPFEVAHGQVPRRFQQKDGMSPGALQFARKCSICHTLGPDGSNRAGPTLFKVFGRKVGSLPGYAYSDTLKNGTFVWNEETIDQLFAQGPDVFVPGTKMPLQKMDNAEQRRALIEFLKEATQEGG